MRPAGGGAERKLTTYGPGYRFHLTWSPDGKKLAFVDQTMTIRVFDLESGHDRPRGPGAATGTSGGSTASAPSWSADSRVARVPTRPRDPGARHLPVRHARRAEHPGHLRLLQRHPAGLRSRREVPLLLLQPDPAARLLGLRQQLRLPERHRHRRGGAPERRPFPSRAAQRRRRHAERQRRHAARDAPTAAAAPRRQGHHRTGGGRDPGRAAQAPASVEIDTRRASSSARSSSRSPAATSPSCTPSPARWSTGRRRRRAPRRPARR